MYPCPGGHWFVYLRIEGRVVIEHWPGFSDKPRFGVGLAWLRVVNTESNVFGQLVCECLQGSGSLRHLVVERYKKIQCRRGLIV